jgi:hypothetical protein
VKKSLDPKVYITTRSLNNGNKQKQLLKALVPGEYPKY